MKLLTLVFLVVFLANSANGSWLSDIYTGLNEAIEDSKVKENFEILGTKIKKVGSEAIEKVKNDADAKTFKHNWVSVTKEFLKNIEFKQILKEKGDAKMEELVQNWNGVFMKLNEADNSQSTEEMKSNGNQMYKTVKENLKDLLSPKAFNQWKKNVTQKIKDVVSKEKDNFDISSLKSLKKNVKTWIQPSFMEKKENLEEEKEMVKDVVKSVNKKLKEESEKIGKQVIPVIRMSKEKKDREAAEAKLEKWLEKKFTKPHQESGKSKWELLLQSMPLDKMKKVIQNKGVPFKKVKKQFKKLAKLNKKLLVIKNPIKTSVKKLETKIRELPVFVNEEGKENLESLTIKEKKEYEEAESIWKRKIVAEAIKLSKKLLQENGKSETDKKHNEEKVHEMEEFKDDDDDDDDDEEEDNVQKTKPKLSKEFADKLMKEESEWMELKKKLKSML